MSKNPHSKRSQKRPMTEIDLQHRKHIIALIGFLIVACLVGLMTYFLGAEVWATAAASTGVLTVGVFQFFKTLQDGGPKS